MKKIYRFLLWGVIIAFVYLLIFPIPMKVDKTISAVEVSLGDPSFCEPVNIIIDGTYHWKMLGDDTFNGNIKFDAYPFTMENTLAQGTNLPTLRFEGGIDSLDYGEWLDSESFGKIHTKPFFKAFIVQVFINRENGEKESWSTVDGRCIVAPASNKEEALSILRRISNNDLAPYEYWIE
ncbi:hypothetical protein [Proteiniborus sp. MB09-C3]|uniref:hypothetical protein n=1 Tax=Proteiniborus sp. MB09-C3 TaxID=3050072 RepID=UPI002556A539|nr:hypothetical protein [Proteiniborus sp. MB09-C3]WIV11633.1 hypothetical protein QO263_16245 [Proteiniborus sp. MB09-C3]